MAGEVKFFCENCGNRVTARDRICPSCGRFFSKVRCPSCNFQGMADQFILGCPQCGFMGFTADVPSSKTPANKNDTYEVIPGLENKDLLDDNLLDKNRDIWRHKGVLGVTVALFSAIIFLIIALLSRYSA